VNGAAPPTPRRGSSNSTGRLEQASVGSGFGSGETLDQKQRRIDAGADAATTDQVVVVDHPRLDDARPARGELLDGVGVGDGATAVQHAGLCRRHAAGAHRSQDQPAASVESGDLLGRVPSPATCQAPRSARLLHPPPGTTTASAPSSSRPCG
jgi:hypothetical protein